MKILILALAPLVVALLAAGCQVSEHSQAAGWTSDFPAALERARKESKLVLLDFTGSDWCPPCKMLHTEVFSSAEFKAYATSNLIPVELDFPQSRQQSAALRQGNEALREKYAVAAFPTIVLLNSEGKELWRQVGLMPGGTAAWIARIESSKSK